VSRWNGLSLWVAENLGRAIFLQLCDRKRAKGGTDRLPMHRIREDK